MNMKAGVKKIESTDEAWENRDLGADGLHVGVVGGEEAQTILEAAGTQAVSIRLQKSLIEDLKNIASLHGLAYQTLVKQVLNRFVEAEKKLILRDMAAESARKAEKSASADKAATKNKKAA